MFSTCVLAPKIISKSKLNELSRCRFRFGKTQANEVREIAKIVCSKELDFEKVKKMSYPEAKVKLMSIGHGIGNKVADCVLLFSLDKLESFPVFQDTFPGFHHAFPRNVAWKPMFV